jgi:effector-binding domain-containing protein
MSLLKKIGLGFLGFIALLIVVGFMLPGKTHVERSLVIKASAEPVFQQVNTLKNWEKWSPWHQIDPKMKLAYEGPEAGVGAKYIWTSNDDQVGNGTLTIKESTPNQFIKTAMDFGEMGTGFANYKFETVADGTKVTWSMDSNCDDMPWQYYLPSKYMCLFMDGLVGKDFEKGLNNLKKVVESQPQVIASAYKVEEKSVPATQALTIKTSCKPDQISKSLGECYGEISAYMKKNKLEFAGQPFAIYHKYGPQGVEMEAGIPVAKAGKSSGRIQAKELKAGPVAMVAHYGKYEDSEKAHAFVDSWLTQNKKQVTGSPWEVYVTDPAKEKDPNKWLTEVYYPL